MLRTSIFRVVLIASALGLGACATGYGSGGYAGVQYGGDFDSYYGNPLGYRSVPYGYVGSGFGWSNGY